MFIQYQILRVEAIYKLPLTSSRSLAMLRKELIMIQQYNKQPHNNNNTQQQRNHHSASHPSILAKHNYYSTMVRFIRARLHLLCVAWDSDLHIYMSTVCESGVRSFGRLAEWRERECFRWRWSKVLPLSINIRWVVNIFATLPVDASSLRFQVLPIAYDHGRPTQLSVVVRKSVHFYLS